MQPPEVGGPELPTTEDGEEALLDKLRSGDYGELIASAQKGQDAQKAAAELCLQKDGSVVKADPHKAFYSQAGPEAKTDYLEKTSYEDDLKKLRQERMRQMQDEKRWKELGHGEMRELTNEREFLGVIKPHERAVVLLDDGLAKSADEVLRALQRLAKRHIETQFCCLHADNAFFLTQMVELEGLPAIFIVEEGKVTKQLTPAMLFEYSSASSPLFIKHLARALLRVGGISNAEGGSSSAEEDEEQDSYARRRGSGDAARRGYR